MRYLSGMHLEYAIRHGKTIEQFLGGFEHNGEKAVRYLSIRKKDEESWLILHDLFDQGTADLADLYNFEYLDLPENRWEPYPLKFTEPNDALRYAQEKFGASLDRRVNSGVVQTEYSEWKQTRN